MSRHSPLGFSGAERWANCEGSTALIASLPPGVDEADPEYRKAGVAAHAAAAYCLRFGADAWETAHQLWDGCKLTADDLDAIQVYLNVIRGRVNACFQPILLIETRLSAPEIHELAYGTVDHAIIAGARAEVTDYKHGEGIWIDPSNNWQLMGYASLLLNKYPQVEQFLLRIVQPRCQPYDGPREWEISAEDLRAWVKNQLYPAMWAASDGAGQLNPGSWCRFCRAKDALACPAIEEAARTISSSAPLIERLSDERLGRLYELIVPAQIHFKAVTAEVERRRIVLGRDIPGSKTVVKKAWRVWKDSAADAMSHPDFWKRELRSPAEVEQMGKHGQALVREFAYSPDAGYTVAPLSDRRHPVTVQVQSVTDRFALDSMEEKS